MQIIELTQAQLRTLNRLTATEQPATDFWNEILPPCPENMVRVVDRRTNTLFRLHHIPKGIKNARLNPAAAIFATDESRSRGMANASPRKANGRSNGVSPRPEPEAAERERNNSKKDQAAV